MKLVHPSANRLRQAFSLVEVLVAVGIMAILMAILLPTVTRVRKQAQTIKCEGHMRQILIMTNLYCNDWEGVLPYTNWGDGPAFTPNRHVGYPGWAYDGNVPGARGTYDESDIQTGVLYKYAGSSSEMFRCPLDIGPYAAQWYTMLTTYCANGSMSGFGGTPRNISEFKAGQAAIYWEVGATAGGGEGWDGANYPWEGISVRHAGSTTTVGFLDGHVTLYDVNMFNSELNHGPSTLYCDPRSLSGGFVSVATVVAIRDN